MKILKYIGKVFRSLGIIFTIIAYLEGDKDVAVVMVITIMISAGLETIGDL